MYKFKFENGKLIENTIKFFLSNLMTN